MADRQTLKRVELTQEKEYKHGGFFKLISSLHTHIVFLSHKHTHKVRVHTPVVVLEFLSHLSPAEQERLSVLRC